MPQSNILTIDIEGYCEELVTAEERAGFRLGIERILALLARHKVQATFFVLGVSIECDMKLLDEMAAAGHEIGTHGYGHRHLWQVDMAEFREDLKRSIGLLSDRVGRAILGHRAPQFSVPRDRTAEFFAVIAQCGLTYDASVFPFKGRRYGLPHFARGISTVNTPHGEVLEVPASIRRMCGLSLPVAGGGYWRLLPGWITSRNVRHLNRAGLPMVSYLHNYEFEPRWLSSANAQITGRLRRLRLDLMQNILRGTMYRKVDRLLEQFPFTSVEAFLRAGGYLEHANGRKD